MPDDTKIVPEAEAEKLSLGEATIAGDKGTVSVGGSLRAATWGKKLKAKVKRKGHPIRKVCIALIPLFTIIGLSAMCMSFLELDAERQAAVEFVDQTENMADLIDKLGLRHTEASKPANMLQNMPLNETVYNLTKFHCSPTPKHNGTSYDKDADNPQEEGKPILVRTNPLPPPSHP